MKKLKAFLTLGILWATLTATPLESYAYAASTITVESGNPYGLDGTQYTATLDDGTILGFRFYSNNMYSLTGAISQNEEIIIPDSIKASEWSEAIAIGYIEQYQSTNYDDTQSVVTLRLPKTIEAIYVLPPSVKTLHMNNYVSNINQSTLSNLDKVLVPEEKLTDYLNDSNWRRNVLINAEGAEPLKISINMTKTGEFAQLLLQQTDDWYKVNELTVTGDLNENDLNVFKRMEQLTDLDLSKANIGSIPDNFSGIYNYGYGLSILKKVVFPEIESIGSGAFYGCSKLKDITISKIREIMYNAFCYCGMSQINLPEGLESIGDYAFRNSRLESVTIPSSVTKIPYYCFESTPLSSVSIPSSVTTIGEYAFYNCSQLSEVEFGEGLDEIGSNAFYNCTALTKIDLPGTLSNVNGSSFGNCTNLKSVTSRAVIPPTHNGGYSALYGCDMTDVTLYVPAMSIDTYRAEQGWSSFYTILPMEDKVSYAYIYDEVTVDNPSVFTDDCTLRLGWNYQYRNGKTDYWYGALNYSGSSTFSVSDYRQHHYQGGYSYANPYYYNSVFTSLISNGAMRADNVKTSIIFNKSIWYFISLPYDVKVSDITYPDETQFVIRKYSGSNRAQQAGNTWLDLTADSIMHAYEGYIFRCNKDQVDFVFPALNNANKNKVFEKESVVMPLGEYLSEFEHNRSWNLVGNPYPCYYDTRYIDFTAPITVWNRYNQRYDAYSPVDDSFILSPTQAFFVQCPVNQPNITFNKEGRQKNADVRDMGANAPCKAPGMDSRKIFNMTLSDGEMNDRTRVVINGNATCGYELDKDASKFINDDNSSLLVYTIHDGVRYAINERPLADGIVSLGFYAPKAGDYVLSLDTTELDNVVLTDNMDKKETDMAADYHFSAEAGYNDARFILAIGATTGIESITVDRNAADAATSYSVYTTDGRMMGNFKADEITSLPKGIYIVSSNGANRKIVVK